MTLIMKPSQTNGSFFGGADYYPPDANVALTEAYHRDPSPKKVNLGQGAYRDAHDLPKTLRCVEEALDDLNEKGLDHEYLPILGLHGFRERVTELVIGKDICESKKERYYNPNTKSLDFEAYMAALNEAEPGTVVILHACAHNPTGCDPSQDQWRHIGQIIKQQRLFPVFDAVYLGFNSGSYDRDAFPIRHIINELELEAAICISFAANMGLYGQRVGCLLLHTSTPEAATSSTSVLERLQHGEISSPPAYGAKIVENVLSNPVFTEIWHEDMANMSNRISSMRNALYNCLLDH
ncbi:hypothetical protein ACHAPQ_012296, partial [Fusarium lateritium]